jgi:hypothetical protein
MRPTPHREGPAPGMETNLSEHLEVSRKDREFPRREAATYDHSVTRTCGMYHHWDLRPWVDALTKLEPAFARRSATRCGKRGASTGTRVEARTQPRTRPRFSATARRVSNARFF